MDLTKYQKKGYTGLANLGNTCFLNSAVQVLNHTYELNAFLESKSYTKHLKEIPDTKIVEEWLDLQRVIWSNNGVVSPNRFVYNIQRLAKDKNRELFTGWAQNDMPEFLLFMVECLHNSISRSIKMRILGNVENDTDKMATACYGMLRDTYAREYSEIMDLFYGISVSEIASMDRAIVHSAKPESFFILDLQILPEMRTLYDCFDAFTQVETLDGDNAWFNEKTGQKEDIQKRMTFWNFPKVLIITLNRFSPCGQYKLNNYIDFPLTDLDLSKYVSGYNAHKYRYDLYGVCNHSGNVNGGHYTAYVLNASDEWVYYNDTCVDVIDSGIVVSPQAYCLFYRKKIT
jgi:ubiquitin C-terminal hydrolase